MFVAFEAIGARGDIWILPLAGDRTPFPFVQTPFDEREPMFSADGRWLAYRSDESGRSEVYVRPFPKGEGRWLVSTNGGTMPHWRGDGRELFYQVNQEIWAVPIAPTPPGSRSARRIACSTSASAAPAGMSRVMASASWSDAASRIARPAP